ncbi:MAG: glyoxalase/bleomycin resistance/dioxygenase family protein [Gemmatimonadota bacterium]
MHTRFLAVELRTHVADALRDFYGSVLGLRLETLAQGFLARTGASLLRFRPTTDSEPVYHIAFNIPENQIDAARDWLRDRAELIPHFKTGDTIVDWPAWNAHSVYFLDPAGNLLEAIARHALANARRGDFDTTSFLNISELGLVVPDPHVTIDQLSTTFELPKKSVLHDFGAVGDDNGLFIVSAEHRAWMPTTDVLAEPFPARAFVYHHHNIELSLPGTDYTIHGRVHRPR